MKKKEIGVFKTVSWIFAILVVLVMLALLLFPVAEAMHSEVYIVTVTDKAYSGEADGYIVWCEDDNGVTYEFTNQDMTFRGKFNSSTIQGKLKEGSKYRITVCGWRVPLLSMYPNIIEVEQVISNQ